MASTTTMTVRHNGQELWLDVHWESRESTGIFGLCFTVKLINDEYPTPEEGERLSTELEERYDTDTDFMEHVCDAIDGHYEGFD